MQKRLVRFALLLGIALIFSISLMGQIHGNGNGSDTLKMRIYMDCWDCDFAYFRKNLPYLDFVRDPNMSDVHLLVTEQMTASGGREYGLNFIGSGTYSDLHFKLTQAVPPSSTRLETWQTLLKKTEMILRQPWGEIDTRLEGSHYFHDFSKNNLNLRSHVSVNVTRGLSFYLLMFAELIHDQLYLPAGDVSLEELLLRQRQLQTSYDISAQFGITFTFGSIYNNIVNQRL